MTLNAQNLVAWHDRTTADLVAQRDNFADLAFRPLSLPRYGSLAFLSRVPPSALAAECKGAW